MRHHPAAFLLALALLLPGCSGSESAPATSTPEPTGAAVVESTTEPVPTEVADATDVTATATAVIPSPTQSPTEPPTPEATPTPIQIPTAAPTARPTKIKPTSTPISSQPAATNTVEETSAANVPNIDPLQLVARAEHAATQLDTARFKQEIRLDTSGFRQITKQECQIEAPSDSYCLSQSSLLMEGTEPVSFILEVVQRDDLIWTRTEEEAWILLPTDAIEAAGISLEGLEQLRMSQFMLEASLEGITEANGLPMYEVGFTLDVVAYMSLIYGEEAVALFGDGADSSGQGMLWIGVDSNLTHRSLIEMTLAVDEELMNVTVLTVLYGVNAPVEIPDPTASG